MQTILGEKGKEQREFTHILFDVLSIIESVLREIYIFRSLLKTFCMHCHSVVANQMAD